MLVLQAYFLKFNLKGRRTELGFVRKPPLLFLPVRSVGQLNMNIRVLGWLGLGLGLELGLGLV